MVNHATFKASLFMAAGIVDHETGTRDLGRLSGLQGHADHGHAGHGGGRVHGGVPLLNGFISKEMFFAETTFVSGDWTTRAGCRWRLPLPAPSAWPIRCASSCRVGPPATDLPRVHEPPRWMLFPSALLVFMCLLVGVFPAYTVGPFRHGRAEHPGRGHARIQLAVWQA